MNYYKQLPIVLMMLALSACASNPGIVNISPDTYLISRTDISGVFGSPAAFRAKVLEEAREFAESQGKVAIPLSLDETPRAPGQFYSIDYQFRVVSEDDPEYARVTLEPRPDFVSESNSTVDLNVNSDSESPDDIYEQLLRLDDLRERGILTESEFQAEKQKLLEQ